MNALHAVAAWFAGLATYKQVLLGLATTMFLTELVLSRVAPKSSAYRAWKRCFEAVGSVWTAVLLSIVYGLSVGPTSLIMRLAGKDPLDRALRPGISSWRRHEPNPLGAQAAARHQF